MSVITWAVVLLAGVSCAVASGTQATIQQYPSVVQIEDRVGLFWLQQCVGSVLTSFHILSAASCFPGGQDSARVRRIRAGTASRGSGGDVREVSEVNNHPNYGSMGNDGDITVIRLESALTLGANIQQGSIIGEGIYLPDGLELTIAGWGTTAEGGEFGNNDLYSLDVFTVNSDRCLETYLLYENSQTITENMICSGLRGTDGRDFDSRDAGGPVFYSGVIVGVSSFGVSRGNDEYPLVSSAVGSYTSWIVEAAS